MKPTAGALCSRLLDVLVITVIIIIIIIINDIYIAQIRTMALMY